MLGTDWKRDFPILAQPMNGKPMVYLDNGATTQKPQMVVDALRDYYEKSNANPHRGAYALSVAATNIYETARARTRAFLNAAEDREIIFTKNATESLNLVAYSYGMTNVGAGDEIVVTILEHHSNIVPWQRVAKAKGATLKYIYLEDDGNLDLEDAKEKITAKTKIVVFTHVSNVLGLVNPAKELIDMAHAVGAVAIVDGAQSVPHIAVDVQSLDADFYAFSGHKMLSPMGIGVLYGRRALLEAMPPFLSGGDMIEYVEEQETTYAELPYKFEAGTQNVGAAAGLIAAIDYLENVGFSEVERIEKELMDYTLPKLREIPYIRLYGCDSAKDNKTGIITFTMDDVHPHDVSTILDEKGVAIRAGHHCAQPLGRYLGAPATCRASFYLYNTKTDVDRFIEAVKEVREVMRLCV